MLQIRQTTALLFCSKLEIVCFTQMFAKLVYLRVVLIPKISHQYAAGYAKDKSCTEDNKHETSVKLY